MDEEQRSREVLFSARVKAGSKTYFIDVMRAENGAKYMKLSESRPGKDDERHEHHRLTVFEEHVCDFIQAVTEAMPFMRPDVPPGRLSRLREKHHRAYEK